MFFNKYSRTCHLYAKSCIKQITTSTSTSSSSSSSSPSKSSHQTSSNVLNEPLFDYTSDPKSEHRIELEKWLKTFSEEVQEVPIVIGGKNYTTKDVRQQRIPFEHAKTLAKFYYANDELIHKAIECSRESRSSWNHVPLEERASIFDKAADLVSGKYRYQLNAATMLGQAKTIKQAEIDSAAELSDFLRFGAHYSRELAKLSQPLSPKPNEELNEIIFRALDGFVAAISPFNFTAIGGNLAAAPCIMGNTVLWKPSDTSILSNYLVFKVFQEAGFPDGVINFIPSEGFDFGRVVTSHPQLAGINFTGSLATFQWLWSEVGLNIRRYETFPRLIGECGGKNYHFIHKSADNDLAVAQTIRSAFEYSGQKCSACSRLYVPDSIWNKTNFKDNLIEIAKNKLKIGPPTEFDTFASAVIDSKAFKRIKNYQNYAKSNPDELKILCGGESDDSVGYYVQPTIIETKNAENLLMKEEIFGPILTVYVYPESESVKTLDLINECPFALTGGLFAREEEFLKLAIKRLKMSAGNFYINDKSTGAVVGQHPFGGSKLSGTNDKAGGIHFMMRWCNQQTLKRTFKRSVEYL